MVEDRVENEWVFFCVGNDGGMNCLILQFNFRTVMNK